MLDPHPAQGDAQNPLSPRISAKRPSPSRDSLPSHKRIALDSTAARVAIIAHLFSVSSALSPPPPAAASSLSPFDDPFSSASSATASGADMCLGLEMLRGAPIALKGDVRVRRGGSPVQGEKAPFVSAGRKGKGRAREDPEVEIVDVETPTDVRVYIDARCPETVEWLEDAFCREGREGYGVKLDAGGEEVILFASLPALAPLAEEQENLDPAASTSAQLPRPPLTLLLGRRARATVRKPRPDDPLPRENLFANKLRKTASLPASAFTLSADPAPPPPAKKPKRQTAKDKAIASLLSKDASGAAAEMAPPARSRARATSSQPPGIAFPPPAAAAARPFARSASSRFPSTATGPLARQASLPPLAGLGAARRSSAPGAAPGQGRAFQRTLSRSSMLLDSPPGSDDEAGGGGDLARMQRRGSRAPSPTPSLASVLGDEDGEGEGADAVAELRSFGAGRRSTGGMARSSSLPVGTFALGTAAGAGPGQREEKGRSEREGTALPVAGVSEGSAAPEGTAEARNKNTVKKLTLARMTAMGCGKSHGEFRDVFSFTTRGVGFAMRATFKTSVLSPAEREHASSLIDAHLKLYLPASPLPTPSPTPGPAHGVVKSEPDPLPLTPAMPSPKSLGDGLGADEGAQAGSAAPGEAAMEEDVDMDETQVHEEEAAETQLPEGGTQPPLAEDAVLIDEEEEDVDEVVLVSVQGAAEVKMEPVHG
ncbi:hypothetical protein JCM10449v2_000730 [Rhodotorula kratochvilovae]